MPHVVTARRRRPPRLATKGRHGGLLVVSVSPSAKAPLRRALREAALLHRPAERVSYESYVVSYRVLARAAGVDVESLWRALWSVRPGEVRAGFADSVDAVRRPQG